LELDVRKLKRLTKECVKETEELAKKAGIRNDKLKAEIFGALLLAKLIGGECK